MKDDSTSLTLLQRVQSGSGDAWNELKRLYSPLVYFWIRERGIRGGDVEALHGDVFSNVWSGVVAFKHNGRKGAFRKWIKTIAFHEIADFHKRNPQWSSLHENVGGAEAPESNVEVSEEVAILYRRAWELVREEFSPRDQEVFRRIAENGEAAKHVAEEMGLERTNVYRIISQIKSHVRTRFDGEVDL